MAFTLTENAEQLLAKNQITPQIVVEFEGVSTLYAAVDIKEFWKIGSAGVTIGQPGLLIGGQISLSDQEPLITFDKGTTTQINQVLNVDRGTNESISSITIALLDKSLKATQLITPGNEVADLLGARAKLWYGEAGGSFNEDYFIVFRGVVTDIDAESGVVKIGFASPDTLKKTSTFLEATTELTAAISDVDTAATVTDTSDFLSPFTNRGGTVDSSLELIVRIDDELIRYESTTGTSFGTLTRGYLGTTAVAHSLDAEVSAFYRMQGNSIDLALNFMLSGTDEKYVSLTVDNFVDIPGIGITDNAIYFGEMDIVQLYNVRVGDYISTTSAVNGANNFTNRVITDVIKTDSGTYVVVDGAALVDEDDAIAVAEFFTQYNVWGPNAGLGMRPEEVDIAEHLSIRDSYLQSAQMDIYIKEEIEDGKEFLAEQLYNPVSAYAIPRKAQSSIGYHIGPVPGQNMITLDASTVTNASKLRIKRTINKNFYNTIIYKFDEDPLEDEFRRGAVFIDSDSVDRIKVGNKALTIESKGLRFVNSALNIAQIAADRRLRKYRFAAEAINGVEIKLGDGLTLEVGDKVIVDMADLKLSDIQSSTRDGNPRIFEVVNKRLDIKKNVSIDIVDTNFDLSSRFALIGPCSEIKQGFSETSFVIQPTMTAPFGDSEFRKWRDYEGTGVIVRSPDGSVQGSAILQSAQSNTITVSAGLGFTPLAGYYLELGDYNNQSEQVKLVFGFMSDGDNDFADGKIPYQMS